MTARLEGKIAIVTGAGGGIGREVALVFAREGATVVVADLNAQSGMDTVAAIGDDNAVFIQTDISVRSSVDAMVQETVTRFGRIDIAHNNAGISGILSPFAEISDDEWDRIIAINLTGTFYCLQAEIKAMLKTGGGSIINTASVLGAAAIPSQGHYITTKHGVIGLTRAAAVEYARHGIRVNAVLPGPVLTPLMEQLETEQPGFLAGLAADAPANRLATVGDVAGAVLWLASDESAYAHGSSLVIDGGMLAGA